MKIDGACYCGEVTYEADIDPESVVICHCTDCQTMAGTAFRTIVPATAETFRAVSGTPRAYVKTAESGNRRAHGVLRDMRDPRLGLRRRPQTPAGSASGAAPCASADSSRQGARSGAARRSRGSATSVPCRGY